MLNTVVIDGHVVRDADVRFTNAGAAACNFSIAHNVGKDEKKETHYFDVVAFGKLGESCAEMAKKGVLCVVYGKLQQRRWEKDGVKHSKVNLLAEHAAFKEMKPQPQAPEQDDIPF